MNKAKALVIFESLARTLMALDELTEESLRSTESAEDKVHVKAAVKSLYMGYFDLEDYVKRQYPELDPGGAGKDLFFAFKKKYETPELPARKLTEKELEHAKAMGVKASKAILKKAREGS